MPEEGIMKIGELKIHQASHARYFEDFLKFVEYERSMPEIMKTQVMYMVYDQIEDVFEEGTEEREIMEQFSTEEVTEATAQIVEHAPEVELKLKADHISVKALLADFGDQIYIAKINNRYVLIIKVDTLTFEKGFSPI